MIPDSSRRNFWDRENDIRQYLRLMISWVIAISHMEPPEKMMSSPAN